MVEIIYLFIGFLALSYVICLVDWLVEKTGLKRRLWLRTIEPQTIYAYMDINSEYFSDTIKEWCEMHQKYIEDGKIIDKKD